MIDDAYILKNYYKDDSLKLSKGTLSLFFSAHSLIFCEFTFDFKKIIEFAEIDFNNVHSNIQLSDNLRFVINNYRLTKNYNKVFISILNSNFTLIPDAYKTEINMEVLRFASGVEGNQKKMEHSLNNISFNYAIEQEQKQLIERTFPLTYIRHAGAVSLNLFVNLPQFTNHDIFLNINNSLIEIAFKHNNKLQFYNVYNYQTNEDIIYFLLFSLEQLNLNPLIVKIAVGGQIETSDTLIVSLKKYIKHINFVVGELSSLLKDKSSRPNHYYFTVLNQHLCVL